MQPRLDGSVNGQDESMEEASEAENMDTAKRAKRITRDELEQLFIDVENKALVVDEKWYLIGVSWWKKLNKAVKEGYIDDVTPIDNSSISSQGKDGKWYLKPKVTEKLDYIPVPQDAFKILVDAFGLENEARDVIERTVIKCTLRKNTIIEIHPRVITVSLVKDRSKTIQLSMRNDTVGNLRDRALEELGVTEDKSRVRFYIQHEDRYELLEISNPNDHVDAVFSAEPTILVDILDEDGEGFFRKPTSSSSVDESSSYEQCKRGVCGLHNLGNTCFMASAVQCLSNVPPITEYFLSDRYMDDLNETNPLGTQGELARAYGDLMAIMWSGRHHSTYPRHLKSTIGKFAPRFSGFAQQDSQELLAFLLDGLHEDLNRVKKKPYIEEEETNEGKPDKEVADLAWRTYKMRNDSIIVDKVHGQLKSTLVCPKCSKVSIKFDPFCFLSVPIPVKEKTFTQTILLIFNPQRKWAKFALTVNRKTTVGQMIDMMKSSLGEKDKDIEIVLFTFTEVGSATILPLETAIMNDARIRGELFAMQLTRPLSQSKIIAVRPFYSHRPLTVPLLFAFPPQALDSEEAVKTTVSNECVRLLGEYFANPNSSMEENPEMEIVVHNEKREDRGIDLTAKLDYADGTIYRDYKGSDLIDREVPAAETTVKPVTLHDCISLFTKEEQLSEQDSWYCPQCKEHVRAMKKLDVWRLPEILIVHLKRFQYTRWNREKIDTNISIPQTDFHLRDVLANDHEDGVYDLIAVSHHMGGLGGGHYTATCLNGNKWYYFNDSSVTPEAGPPCGEGKGVSPYLLFYRRREDPSPSHIDEHLEMETDD